MKAFILIIGYALLIVCSTTNSAMCQEIKDVGKTNVIFNNSNNKVIITVNSTKTKTPPNLRQYYEKKTVSIVGTLVILVNGNDIVVPRSVFADLFDVYKATVKESKKDFILCVWGGDGSESYKLCIYFNKERVTRRILYSGEDMVSTEETLYKLVVD